MHIVVDAMGGDFAPGAAVQGAFEAAQLHGYTITLVGKKPLIDAELAKHKGASSLPISVLHADEVIEMDEQPAIAVRQKKNSSMAVGVRLVDDNKADAFISAGNSGGVMATSLMYMKRVTGVSRPALATILPTVNGITLLLDIGANVDCKPLHLFQFAIMGKIYMEKVMNIPNPRVGLLSIGSEEGKGNELTIASYDLLAKSTLNFIGNMEGKDIPRGRADVVVCDGFVGNNVLKFGEGVAEMMLKLVKEELKAHPIAWASLPFLWTALKGFRKKVDFTEYGGAPLLGVDGISIIAHGNSNAKAIRNAINVAAHSAENKINTLIASELPQYEQQVKVQAAV